MAENSNISWTDHTHNPWIGCTKISPGCAFCYADTQDKLRKWTPEGWGKGKPRKRTSESNWKQPLKWNREAKGHGTAFGQCDKCGERAFFDADGMPCGHPFGAICCGINPIISRPRVFCASLADWLDDEVPIEWLADMLKLIHDTPNLDWQLLSKRVENFFPRIKAVIQSVWTQTGSELISEKNMTGTNWLLWLEVWLDGTPPTNVWMGTSVENQEYADKRIPELLKIPAKVRFLSMEPLLGPVKITEGLHCPFCGYTRKDMGEQLDHHLCKGPGPGIHQVIVGGESGGKRRPMKLEWAQSLHDQCKAAGVAFFFKQVSAFKPGCLDGVPAELMKQEFPK